MTLIRRQAIEKPLQNVHGDIALLQPLSLTVYFSGLFAFIIAILIWLNYSTFARTESVAGVLTTTQPSAKIVVSNPGIITRISVTEGEYVRAGTHLLTVSTEKYASDGGNVAARSLSSLVSRAKITENQISINEQRRQAEVARLDTIVRSAERQSASLASQIEVQKQIVNSTELSFDNLDAILNQGFITRNDYERRRQAVLSSRQTLELLEQRLVAMNAEGEQARRQIAVVNTDARQAQYQIEQNRESIDGEKAKLQGEQGYDVHAPISGYVTAINTNLGRAISPNYPAMLIAPRNSTVIAELYVTSSAVGFVEIGQDVRLMYDAYPFQNFGSYRGVITSASKLPIDPRELQLPVDVKDTVYKVHVSLDSHSINAYGRRISLKPGMTLKANMILDRQTFLQWLLKPLYAVVNRT